MSEAKVGTILILGATGKVGTPTVRALQAKLAGAGSIRLLVRDVDKAKKDLALPSEAGVQFVKGDLSDLRSVTDALKGCERVFLIHPTGEPRNVEAIASLVKQNGGVKLLLHLSVISARPSAVKNSILYNHWRSEEAVHALGVPYVFLRPTFFFQNWFGDAGSIKQQGAIYRPASSAAMSQIDARDIADAAVVVLTSPDVSKFIGRTYHLTGADDSIHKFEDSAKLLSAATGKQVKLVTVEDGAWYGALQQHGVPEPVAWVLLKLYQDARAGLMSTFYGDFKILTGKEPRKVADFFAENKAAFV